MSGRIVLVRTDPPPPGWPPSPQRPAPPGWPASTRWWAAHRTRPADRLLARVLGTSLDRRLAAGAAPESSRLLAVRAQQLVVLNRRRALARSWDRLLEMAAGPPSGGPRALLCRDRVVGAAAEIRDLAGHLRAPLPVAATGVAAARLLLTDAAGPVYNRRDRTGLEARLREISALLDPAVPLQSLVRSNT